MTALLPRRRPPLPERSFCVYGFGVTGAAVTRALRARGLATVVCDDHVDQATIARADRDGVDLRHPDRDELHALVASVDALIPTPGLPETHPVLAAARRLDRPVLSEFDLAAAWDDRPIVAITGTNGKTTVTTLVTLMLQRSGVNAVDAGNTEVPLVDALSDAEVEVFVVEASSFRLGHSRAVSPAVATWLNFAPDHLDVHASLASYEAAKARIWSGQLPGDTAVANADDPVVMSHATGPASVVTFGLGRGDRPADYRVDGGRLVGPDHSEIIEVGALPRALPHDLSNALAAAATARAAGATPGGVFAALSTFTGLAHRVQFVAEIGGVRYYDDSKATTPHATASAVTGFPSVVLVAGGRNKGLDLAVLGSLAPPVRAVVGIGEAATDVVSAFPDLDSAVATTMEDAVIAAQRLARPGDAVVLSPACASFDWYRNYHERGEDFAARVKELAR